MEVDAESASQMEQVPALTPCALQIRTLGGSKISLPGLGEETTILQLRLCLAHEMQAPAFSIKLMMDSGPLEGESRTLREAGLSEPGASILLIRCRLDGEACLGLFKNLLDALASRDFVEARRLIDQGAGLDEEGNPLRANPQGQHEADPGAPGCTLLHLAVRESLTDLALHLVARGVDVHAPNEVGRQALTQCAIKGLRPVAEALLSARADPAALDNDRRSALSYAAQKGDDALTALLVDAAGNARGLRGQGCSVLLCSARGMPRSVLAILKADIDGSIDVNKRDASGRTALHFAYAHSMDEVAATLLARGADSNARSNDGLLPQQGVPSVMTGHSVQLKPICIVQ